MAAASLVSPSPQQVAQAQPRGAVQKAGVTLLALLLFLQYSRVMDLTFWYLHIPLILLSCVGVLSLLSPNLFKSIFSKPGLLILAFAGWIIAMIPFSIWVGGSMEQLSNLARIYYLGILILVFCTTLPDIMLISRFLAYSVAVAAVTSLAIGHTEGGRLVFGQGTFGDPNEFAATLLLGLPLLAGVTWTTRKMVGRFLGIAAILVVLLALLRTGSRGGLITLVAALGLFMWRLPLAQKLLALVLTIVVGSGIWISLPSYLQARFTTLFNEQSVENDELSARYGAGDVGSSHSRMNLLKDGVRMTIQNPLFGVGPGMFPLARFEEGKAVRVNRGWLVTHNSYLQISSETGIPGLILLIALLVSAWKALRRATKRPEAAFFSREYHLTALHLNIALAAFSIAALFLSMVYTPTFVVLAALSHAFERAAQAQIAAPAAAPAIAPLPLLKLSPAQSSSSSYPAPATMAGFARTPGGSALRRRLQSSS